MKALEKNESIIPLNRTASGHVGQQGKARELTGLLADRETGLWYKGMQPFATRNI